MADIHILPARSNAHSVGHPAAEMTLHPLSHAGGDEETGLAKSVPAMAVCLLKSRQAPPVSWTP
jgi:hypothetical protein